MKMICISCPRGCEMDVVQEAGEVVVKGNACPRGEDYGRNELINPTRMVTGLVKVAGMRKPLPVKTSRPVPKGAIDAVLFSMHQMTVQLPVKIGDVIIQGVAGTGVDIVATANM
ncbi:MAG: DUF1667 domain-containing protein [Kiritimatiellae bacterium]|nr:DUF1667 domain-containing protein [Kiritimatiellia bacterium]